MLLSALTAAAQGYGQYGNNFGNQYGGGGGGFGNPLNSGGGGSPYLQNYYNRNSQPLSPYLNLLRGGNLAANYFYGVRPGLMGGAFGSPFGGGNQGMLGRQTFFPQVDNLYDLEDVGKLDGMPPTGHAMGFNNTLNYFGGTGYGMMGQRNQQQQRATMAPTRGSGVR
jgi:hypothetical protein